MTIVYDKVIIKTNGSKSRQLSQREIASIVDELQRMFGVLDYNTPTFQYYLDRYCQHKGIRPLLITDAIL